MPSIGPQLPPHLSKRKRTPQDDGHSDSDSDSDSDLAPPPPPGKLPRREGPAPVANEDEVDLDDAGDARPSLPRAPAPAPARPARGPAPQARPGPGPPTAPTDSDSDSDDYGPSLPSASAQRPPTIGPALPATDDAAPRRDSWMLAPPPAGGGYNERDPTRIRARKFASKPSAGAPPPGAPSVWTETPEEKLRRLQNAVLGRSEPEAAAAASKSSGARSDRDEERDRKISASIEAQRGGSLYDEHSQKRRHGGVQKGEEDDDPSQRPFDRDKDLALGGKIGTAKRRELVNRAADFGGRFQKGSYL